MFSGNYLHDFIAIASAVALFGQLTIVFGLILYGFGEAIIGITTICWRYYRLKAKPLP